MTHALYRSGPPSCLGSCTACWFIPGTEKCSPKGQRLIYQARKNMETVERFEISYLKSAYKSTIAIITLEANT